MTLAQLVTEAQSSQKSSKSTSGRGPAYYNKQRQFFIVSMMNDDDPVVRKAAVECEFVPTKVLVNAFLEEDDSGVLRSILMQPKLPVTSLIAFASEEKCTQFENDEELCDHLRSRIAKES